VSDDTTSDIDESAPETEPTPGEDVATYKRRLAGKDQALTKAQQERDRLAAEAESLRTWKAERENADLSEVEKLQKRLRELESEAAAARTEAKKAALARKSPAYADFLDTIADVDLTSEEAADAFEEFLTKRVQATAEPDREPRIDPNNPRSTPAKGGLAKMKTSEIVDAIGAVDASLLQGTR
jgi:DNA repair exonuclease SbcCD ATPase subunit